MYLLIYCIYKYTYSRTLVQLYSNFLLSHPQASVFKTPERSHTHYSLSLSLTHILWSVCTKFTVVSDGCKIRSLEKLFIRTIQYTAPGCFLLFPSSMQEACIKRFYVTHISGICAVFGQKNLSMVPHSALHGTSKFMPICLQIALIHQSITTYFQLICRSICAWFKKKNLSMVPHSPIPHFFRSHVLRWFAP